MNRLILVIILLSQSAQAYDINGYYARLIKCTYVSRGAFYGYQGLYEVNREYITLYFGNNYCPY